ncbi:hypothetical protein [Micromonospora sp. CPCC 206061]|uniref:hypothetical protein n=1 Tax=Micromonospora sp. CPCC 206061 TaxID=3122410 RepID=UPI002FF0B86D
MRHFWTLIAAVVIAPLSWLLLAYGQDRSIQAFANEEDRTGAFDNGDFVRPVVCLAAAGLLLGLLATLRFSPLGATAAGLFYSASYLALLVQQDTVMDLLPNNVSLAGRDADPAAPLRTGMTMVLGALLLVAVVSVGRWRRWPVREDAAPESALTALLGNRPLGAEGLGEEQPDPYGPAGDDDYVRGGGDYAGGPHRSWETGHIPHTWPSNRR